MPSECEYCPMCRFYRENGRVWCNAANRVLKQTWDIPDWTHLDVPRPSWCPIIGELPEHGDLIDRDELKKHKRHSEEFCENIVSVAHIDWMPTIVPATERSKT